MTEIAPILCQWYASQGRDLPWRQTRDPYRIWLSEVILQQTRVAQGTAYYLCFTERFFDVQSLAAATEDEVLKLWQGLGYYSRARNLHAAAKQIVEQFGGVFPRNFEDVRSLRGVGDYTAAAVCSLSYDDPCAVLDGNVYRVLSRVFDVELPIDTLAGKRAFAELAQSQLDVSRPSVYNQAIMDFGALQCVPVAPRCEVCPLASCCLALAAGTVAMRPVKQATTKVRERWFNYLHITSGDRLLLHRRAEGDIWQGLYEFPLIETPAPFDFAQLSDLMPFREVLGDSPWHLVRSVESPRHQLTHQTLHAVFHQIESSALTASTENLIIPIATLGDYAVPRLIERYLIKYTI
ncbi:MAG: A/G-specific adenine glycosylase [Alistipes sp.]